MIKMVGIEVYAAGLQPNCYGKKDSRSDSELSMVSNGLKGFTSTGEIIIQYQRK